MPRSARAKIGASGSLLTATMALEVCIPARCWMAPEMPAAMYSWGDNGLAGLADLVRVRIPASIDGGA